jgi:hypothetical protein
MTKQPFGTKRAPVVPRSERPIDPATGKPEIPMAYDIILPTGAGEKVIGRVQRVPAGSKGSRDHWRPWPASLAEGEMPEVITTDAAYIKAIEVLVTSWLASEPKLADMIPVVTDERVPAGVAVLVSGDSAEVFAVPDPPSADAKEEEATVLSPASASDSEAVLAPLSDGSEYQAPGYEGEQEPEGIDLSGVAVLGKMYEGAADVALGAPAAEAGVLPGHLIPPPGQDQPGHLVNGISVQPEDDITGERETDGMWENNPPADAIPPAPVSEADFTWNEAPVPAPPLAYPPPPAAATSDLSWLATPAVAAPAPEREEPSDPFNDPRVTPYAG